MEMEALSLTIAAANYNANDSWAHTASSLTLTGAGDVEYTFEGERLFPSPMQTAP